MDSCLSPRVKSKSVICFPMKALSLFNENYKMTTQKKIILRYLAFYMCVISLIQFFNFGLVLVDGTPDRYLAVKELQRLNLC